MAFFFFFQAEDGIRDLTVTGVQTCALPICSRIITQPPSREGRTHEPPKDARPDRPAPRAVGPRGPRPARPDAGFGRPRRPARLGRAPEPGDALGRPGADGGHPDAPPLLLRASRFPRGA